MSPEAIERAATLLAALRLREDGQDAPLSELPDDCRPATLDDAYDIQDRLRAQLSEQAPGPQVGWKIGCTTPVMQRYLDIPHPCAGTLYRSRLHRDRVVLAEADFFELGLECEIAVRLGDDIPLRHDGHDADSVAAAVGGVMASVEIVEHRFVDFRQTSTPSLVADDFFSAGCVIGAESTLDSLGDLATISGGFALDAADPEEGGTGAAILGHPLTALAWLAEHLASRGDRLRAGQIVTLGSVVKTIYPKAGQRVEARFDRLPPVTIEVF